MVYLRFVARPLRMFSSGMDPNGYTQHLPQLRPRTPTKHHRIPSNKPVGALYHGVQSGDEGATLDGEKNQSLIDPCAEI